MIFELSGSVLICVGDISLRALFGQALRDRGFLALEAGSLEVAKKLAEQHRIDLVVVSSAGSEPTTSWLTAKLREGSAECRVVVLTSEPLKGPARQALATRVGADAVLASPLSATELVQFVERALGVEVEEPKDALGTADLAGWSAGVKSLLAEYAQTLRQTIAGLGESIESAVATADVPRRANECFIEAQRLHHAAAAHGFSGVAREVSTIEHLLSALMQNPSRHAELVRQIQRAEQRALEELGVEIKSFGANPPPRHEVTQVLYVSTDGPTHASVTAMARQTFAQVRSARTREQAIDLARENRFDGFLVDIDLEVPGSGFQLVETLQAIQSGVPWACASADLSLERHMMAMRAGAAVFLAAPVQKQDFEEAVQAFLSANTPRAKLVLCIEPDQAYARSIEPAMKQAGLELRVIDHPRGSLDGLLEHLDLLLVNVDMGDGGSGIELCRVIRMAPSWRDLPVVFLGSTASSQTRTACFRAGADDFMDKSIPPDELAARIGARLERFRTLRSRSDQDALTGAFTRRVLYRLASIRIAEATRERLPLSLVVIDLDRFKGINDTHGHPAGDRVLRQLARVLAGHLRTEDVQCRWGGDEFVVLFLGQTPKAAQWIMTRSAQEFRASVFHGADGTPFQATFSAGVASMPHDGASLEELVRAADRRLYRAKQRGRNRVEAPREVAPDKDEVLHVTRGNA
ncbi:MAG: diguanylate cyclase [Deltaproteobacteria bacterium]|nr:diguanylate cyclase [Deltaproteobacteria bacterium]